MSINIYTSNAMASLAEAMIEQMRQSKQSVFTPQYIITQTEGMNTWLKHQIANQTGIAANIQFKKPSEIIEHIYLLLGGRYSNKVSRQHMDWLIYVIIGDERFEAQFPYQAAYFLNDEMKQWEFALKLTDLLDQYQIYRSETISHWNALESIGQLKGDEKWQAYIWRTFKKYTQNEVLDITEIKRFILQQLKEKSNQKLLQDSLPELMLFGLSIVTPLHLQLFYEISKYINIKWFLNNPAPEDYWMDDQSEKSIFLKKIKGKKVHHLNQGNDLLTSWGIVVQSTFKMLFRTEAFINALEDLPNVPPPSQTLLGTIQNNIFNNSTQASLFSTEQINDGSIVICDHYSMRREVEGVYNYIVNAIQEQRFGLVKEREIIVMVTDIDAYAPFIRAVMDNAPYKFQYSIADERISNGDTVISAFVALLELNGNLFSAASVLQLLQSKYIRERFGIYDVELLRHTIKKASIRFGIENDYEKNIDDTYLVSWKYGLQKIMFGLCMDTPEIIDGDKPFYTLESSDNIAEMQQIIALSAFIEALFKMIIAQRSTKTLQQWKDYVDRVLSTFIYGEEQEKDEEHARIINKLNQNEQVSEYIGDVKISYEVISKRFINALSNENTQKNFLNKGITFCSPLPFRSIPFKIVAILGLNYDAFPRKEQHLDFNLMNKQSQLGDRNVKNNDKHLFLESLLSAENALYLSYTGRSVNNNKTLPPSILIDELLDYIQSGNTQENVRAALIQTHPLHTFSNKYNKDNRQLIPNYLIQEAEDWPFFTNTTEKVAKTQDAYNISTVWKYFDKSIEHYYTKILEVRFEQNISEIEETERFTLNALETQIIKSRLMQARLEQNEAAIKTAYYLNAALPLKNIGAGVLQGFDESINPMYNALEAHTEGTITATQMLINYQYRDILFTGTIYNIFNQQLIDFDWKGKVSNPSRLFLNYLFAKASNDAIQSALLIETNSTRKTKKYTQQEAIELLHQLLDIYIDNRTRASLYSIAFYEKSIKDSNYIDKLKDLVKKKPYHKYLRHALETIDLSHQDEMFEIMNNCIHEIFLKGYE